MTRHLPRLSAPRWRAGWNFTGPLCCSPATASLTSSVSVARCPDWAPLDNADWERDLATWQAACGQSRLTAARHGLDDIGVGVRGGQRAEFSLRWIYSHMIEEYARHNGHADLIRELVDPPAGGR